MTSIFATIVNLGNEWLSLMFLTGSISGGVVYATTCSWTLRGCLAYITWIAMLLAYLTTSPVPMTALARGWWPWLLISCVVGAVLGAVMSRVVRRSRAGGTTRSAEGVDGE